MPLIFELSQPKLSRRGTLELWSEPNEMIIRGRGGRSQLKFQLDDQALEILSEQLSRIVRKSKEES